MRLDPTYLAAFRGGPHPLHPASRAFHAQYIATQVDHGLYRSGDPYSERVRLYAFAGASLWYRRDDFVWLCRGAMDARYRAIADEFEQEAM